MIRKIPEAEINHNPRAIVTSERNLAGVKIVLGLLVIAWLASAPSTQAAGPEGTECQYRVQSGDTLSGIALTQELGSWQKLYGANREAIGDNPNLIRPGLELNVCLGGTGRSVEKDPKSEPAVKPTTIKAPIISEPCEYTNDPDGLPRLVISGEGECLWQWTSAVGDGPFNVWPADTLADRPIAHATTGCPPNYRDGSHYCWDGGKITGGPVRIRPGKEGKTIIEAVGGQSIPAVSGPKNCYFETIGSTPNVWWCAPKH